MLFRSASLLTRQEYNTKLNQFRDHLPLSRGAEIGAEWDTVRIQSLVGWMAQFSIPQHEAIWCNPKWRYALLKAGVQYSDELMTTLRLQHWPKTPKQCPLPNYLPDFILGRIAEQVVNENSDELERQLESKQMRIWRNTKEFICVIRRATTVQRLPPNFMYTLQESLVGCVELRAALHEVGVLTYWNEDEGRVNEPWDWTTAQSALFALKKTNSKLQIGRASCRERV